jgi:hypothetical protein
MESAASGEPKASLKSTRPIQLSDANRLWRLTSVCLVVLSDLQSPQVVIDSNDLGIGHGQSAVKGCLYMGRGDLQAVEGNGPGRRGVLQHDAAETQIAGGPGGRMHAHEGHHAHQDQLLDAGFAQVGQQRGLLEAVGKVLGIDDFTRLWLHQRMDLVARGIGQQEIGAGPDGFMPEVDHGQSLGAEGIHDLAGLGGGLQRALQFAFASRKIVVLNIDYE